MANADVDETTINQRSFVKAIEKYVITANNPVNVYNDFDREKKIFVNYWRALANILDDGTESVLYKYNGVELFCRFSIPFFMKCQNANSFTVSTMQGLLEECFDNVEGEYAGVGHPDWWLKGGTASRLNSAAINIVWQELSRSLHRGTATVAVQI
jgi:hypothetical protein